MANVFRKIGSGLGWTGKAQRREAGGNSAPSGGATIRSKIQFVNNDLAMMRVATAFACERIICGALSTLRMVYKFWGNQDKCFVPLNWEEGAKTNYALQVRPNQYMTASEFYENIGKHLLRRGNAYIYPVKSGIDVVGLKLLHPDCVTFDKVTNTYNIFDTYMGVSGVYTADEVLHIKMNSLDGGYTGTSILTFAKSQLDIAATADYDTLKKLGKGGMGKFIISNREDESGAMGDNDDEELLNFGEDIENQLHEDRDAIVARGQVDVKQLAWSAADMQSLQLMSWTSENIARIYGVPLLKLGLGESASYKDVEASNIALYSECLQPIVNSIENEFNAKLINPDNWQAYRYEFDRRSMQLLDADSEANWIAKNIASGMMTVNEARKYKGLPQVEGGDVVLVSTNLADIFSEKISEGKPSENA